jgi:hypothetical protein
MSVLVYLREGAPWALVIGGAGSSSGGTFELSMYCRMSLPIDRPTGMKTLGPLGKPNEDVRTGYGDNTKCTNS